MADREPIWATNEQGTTAHAYIERPLFPWRTYRPRAACGRAWAPDNPPTPDETLRHCLICTRITDEAQEARE